MDNTIEAVESLIVPDAFTPVIGFRRFGIPWLPSDREYEYCLVQRGHCWSVGEPTVAVCRKPHVGPCGGVTPTQDCGCGLYAWLDIEVARRYYAMTTPFGWLVASVIGWGRVLFDEEFWRAEKAQVVAFADPWDTHAGEPEITRERTSRWLGRAAENYGIPVVPLDELRDYTLMYGEEYVEHG